MRINLSILFLCFISFTQAQEIYVASIRSFEDFVERSEKGVWIQAKERDGMGISYRDLVLNEDVETRQIRVHCTVENTSLEVIMDAIRDQEKVVDWNESIKESVMLSDQVQKWITHTMFDIPFPFSKRDLVAQYEQYTMGGIHYVHSVSIPTYIPEIDHVERDIYSYSQWVLTPTEEHSYDVSFSVITLASSSIPRFLKDPIVQGTLLDSFENFKELVQKAPFKEEVSSVESGLE